MSTLMQILVYAGIAGACIPIGGMIARIERIRPDWLEREFRHFVIAFGGGVLVAAVALVLIPKGTEELAGNYTAALYVTAGGLIFFLFEKWLGIRRREAPQFSAMLLDFIPEAIALGGMFAVDPKSAALLAVLIGIQNLPEGFNAYRELKAHNQNRPERVMWLMLFAAPLGPVMGLLGWYYLTDLPQVVGGIMLFASGGILYLIFQDIAPQARMQRHWAPPLGAVVGFSAALLGKLIIDSVS